MAGIGDSSGEPTSSQRESPLSRDPGWFPADQARRFAALSILAAVLTFVLKLGTYLLTHSVGFLSDAAESVVNLLAALVAFWALTVASRPPDKEHAYGHSKAEYLSSAVESLLIMAAAAGIALAAWNRFMHPRPLDQLALGIVISVVASAINGVVALILLRAGKRLRSITLRADALHLLTDVWTSVGVIVAVALVGLTGILVLDPIVALIVAANIVWTAVQLLRDTAHGILDSALSHEDQLTIQGILSQYESQGIAFHALRTRVAGQRRFVDVHVLVPGQWSVEHGHALCDEIEHKIMAALPSSVVLTHLEPSEASISFSDISVDHRH